MTGTNGSTTRGGPSWAPTPGDGFAYLAPSSPAPRGQIPTGRPVARRALSAGGNDVLFSGLERPSNGQLVTWAVEDYRERMAAQVEADLPDPSERAPRGGAGARSGAAELAKRLVCAADHLWVLIPIGSPGPISLLSESSSVSPRCPPRAEESRPHGRGVGMTAGGPRTDERDPRWDPRPPGPTRGLQGSPPVRSNPAADLGAGQAAGASLSWLGPPSPAALPGSPWPPSPSGAHDTPPGHGGELSSARLLRPVRPVPRSGWRAALFAVTGGLVNPGESRADTARRELGERANQRLAGGYRLAAVSVKGGVGKTSTTALLGATFASLRGDRIVALDANPDRGNLAEKLRRETTATVRTLINDADQIRTASDIRSYTSQSPARLEVLASEADPEMNEAFNAGDFLAASELLARHYNILLTDNGTGIMAPALQASIASADSLLIVTSASIDGAKAAQATVEWLEAHGHRDLIARSVTVVNGVRRLRGSVDLDAVESFFKAHTRATVRLPYDRHIAEGGEIHLERLSRRTRDALLTLAAVIADDFPRRLGLTPPTPVPGPHAGPGGGLAPVSPS